MVNTNTGEMGFRLYGFYTKTWGSTALRRHDAIAGLTHLAVNLDRRLKPEVVPLSPEFSVLLGLLDLPPVRHVVFLGEFANRAGQWLLENWGQLHPEL
ncbi:hypothetical protein V2H45_23060 [Tumidithrix elongata RA019]|uniref:Uncharacterized protein n=1 Tax=Tumidithrix elongata BACA0141 TaxID=2716417 RepID=A0AAW9Q8S6_9CYAN|nr:hypothetical protein [Tumidithrix elongata RA019]